MGAGASIPDAAALLTKDEALAIVGDAAAWDEAQWEAAEKDSEGRVKAEVLLLAAAAAAATTPSAATVAAAGDGELEEEVNDPLRKHICAMWAAMEKDEKGEVERLKCWDIILKDKELAALVARDGNAEMGAKMLEAMKSARALDVNNDGQISEPEVMRLVSTCVLDSALEALEDNAENGGPSAAGLRAKIESMWAAIPKDDKGQVERLKCWRLILADAELASMVGGGDVAVGKRVLLAMKSSRALDVDHDGQIIATEFFRLLDNHKHYSYHPEDQAPLMKHLSSSGGSGGLLKSLKTPPNLAGADLILFKLAQKVGAESDAKTSGFGGTHHPAHVNYFKMFKVLDLDVDGGIELDEFNRAVRKSLSVDSKQCSDAEIETMFACLDSDETGKITLSEFSSFARGAAQSAAYHGELSVYQQRGGAAAKSSSSAARSGGGGGAASNPLSSALSEAEVAAIREDPKKLAMNRGLHDRKAGKAESAALQRLGTPHLVLWHLAQHVAYETDASHSTSHAKEAAATHPANVSYVKLFKALDMDVDGQVTRDEWALTLRRTVGVGSRVTDDDLEALFDAINTDKDGGISLREFAAFARGASSSSCARGISHESKERRRNTIG